MENLKGRKSRILNLFAVNKLKWRNKARSGYTQKQINEADEVRSVLFAIIYMCVYDYCVCGEVYLFDFLLLFVPGKKKNNL